MALIPYFLIERGVFSLLNALEAADVASLQAAIVSDTISDDTELTNAAFTRFSTRLEILNAQEIIAGQCCKTEGHPRRVDFLTTVTLTHLETLPSSVGGLGSLYDSAGDPLTPCGSERIKRIRDANAALVAANDTPTRDLFYTVDGSRFYCALQSLVNEVLTDEDVTAELYTYASPFTNFATLDTLFSATSPVSSLLHNEFRPAVQYLAAGLLAGKVGTYPSEAAAYLQLAQKFSGNLFDLSQVATDYKATGGPS